MALDWLFPVAVAWVLLERTFELALDAHHRARLVAAGGRVVADDGYGVLVLVHAAFLPAMVVEWAAAPWAGAHAATVPLLALFLAADALRYWSMITLGARWTTKVVVMPEAPLIAGGPYRFVRHPIYVAVSVLVPALAAAFGLWATALGLGAANLAAVLRRVRKEEAALGFRPA